MTTDLVQLVAIILGATGFWKLLEMLLQFRADKRLKSAEAKSIHAQVDTQIVTNWVQWSQKLEARVVELEGRNEELNTITAELNSIIINQRNRISELEVLVDELKSVNQRLTEQLMQLKKQ